MILFTIKKAFFDVWDNLFSIVLMNMGLLFVLALGSGSLHVLSQYTSRMEIFFLGVGIVMVFVLMYVGAAAMIAGDIADYRYPELKRFFSFLKTSWKVSVIVGLMMFFQVLIFMVLIPWYLKFHGGFIGLTASAILFWASIFWWFASQYTFPVRYRLAEHVKPVLLKSFVLFFDNPGFTLVLTFGTLLLLLLSFLTAFLFPGIGSILVWHQVAVKLRLYKYDYLEEHPGTNKKYLPWGTLLSEDKRKVGPRTLKSMIFPWKG